MSSLRLLCTESRGGGTHRILRRAVHNKRNVHICLASQPASWPYACGRCTGSVRALAGLSAPCGPGKHRLVNFVAEIWSFGRHFSISYQNQARRARDGAIARATTEGRHLASSFMPPDLGRRGCVGGRGEDVAAGCSGHGICFLI